MPSNNDGYYKRRAEMRAETQHGWRVLVIIVIGMLLFTAGIWLGFQVGHGTCGVG